MRLPKLALFLILTAIAFSGAFFTYEYSMQRTPESQLSQKQSWSTVFQADFESGSFRPYFNDVLVTSCGANDTITKTLAHTGQYSEHDHYNGGPCTENIRSYPTEAFPIAMSTFYVELWVYVPAVNLTDWVSFATLHLTDDTFITIDSNRVRELHVYNGALQDITTQVNPIKWPFDAWFKIGIFGELNPGFNSTIILYQDDVPVVDFNGYTGHGILGRMHLGLYLGKNQGAFNVYNDDIKVLTPYGSSQTPPLETIMIISVSDLREAVGGRDG